jgi:hypothetical protein
LVIRNVTFSSHSVCICLCHPHILVVANWKAVTRELPKTKAELRQILAEAVRNTQPDEVLEPKPAAKISRRKI